MEDVDAAATDAERWMAAAAGLELDIKSAFAGGRDTDVV